MLINWEFNVDVNLYFLNDEIFFLLVVSEVWFNNLLILVVLEIVWLFNKEIIINVLEINVIIFNMIIVIILVFLIWFIKK